MRYDIRLTVEYHYPAASDHVRNILRLLPSDSARQRVRQRILTISPRPDERREGVDFFGNATTLVAWHRPVGQLSFHLRAEAERLAEPEFDLSPPLPALAAQRAAGGLGPASPLHFCAPSARIGASAAIADYARAALPDSPTAREAVRAVGEALHRDMTFDPTATDVTTPPDVAFAARRGVCQDFAQMMIAGLRGLGIPAAYVSGFLRTTPPPGQPRLDGVDAMHGWVSAWCGADQGWVEYDPTNGQWAGEDYVTVAWGRDYADAAPVRGAIRTSGPQDTHHKVDVIPLP
jgi:transglutaminase-like putative cysteine protease